jgi:hypothetical protein
LIFKANIETSIIDLYDLLRPVRPPMRLRLPGI